ncbi:c-type cytochrome [Mucilaginibacter myungsuensis]|uniref:C-type cytochrome n=1 Tax=Mucilaginibacter myungsuensis TaxID=649104 RepID=A0A929KWY9_9SPHI|nr:c-type cytochrome [Mucilaginibacter myungsuensis]MBE9662712.1 c-type cytochrome [Mucilaginibacter myungsuensis]MDN3598132.1 c-type cytochrome [Mucilaginibacter myungsuensis]
MKKVRKWLAIIVIALVVVITAAVSYLTLALPNVGKPENIKISYTPERIKRGKYLATHVTVCMDCHSGRDMSKFGGPISADKLGMGGDKFDPAMGFPGTVYIPNITPFNLKNWTDGELFRAITTGVKKDGSAIFPIMPWASYAKMDREDIYDIIAYIRTLEPKRAEYPERQLDFPLNILIHTMPQKANLGKRPAESDTLKYGEYLVAAAACMDCHTKADKGAHIPGMEFAGGYEFGLPGGATVRSANITPDKDTGIGRWTKDQFVARFRMYADSTYKPADVKPGEFQTVMPWLMYAGMRPADLEAIYAYLKTIKPVKNQVVKFSGK